MEFLAAFKEPIHRLCAELGIRQLYAFGSVNTSRFRPESDVDFLVDIGDQEPAEYADIYFTLAEELERITGRKVDLVTIASIKNFYFSKALEATKKLLYAA